MRLLLLLIVVFLIPSLCPAQYFHINQRDKEIVLGASVIYLRDSAHRYVVEDLDAPAVAQQFLPSDKEFLNFQATNDAIWVRANFICDESGTYFIRVTPQLIDSLTFYTKEGGSWRVQQGGYFSWRQTREVLGSGWIFSFHAEAGDTVPAFLRVQSKMPLIFGVDAGGAIAVQGIVERNSILNGIYIGFMLLMILYNMFLFITNRQTVYLHYSLYTFFAGLFVAFATGAVILLPGWVWYIHCFALGLIPGLFGIFGMTFTREFLITKKYFPNFKWWMIFLTSTVAVTVAVEFIDRAIAGILIQLVGGTFSLLVIYCGIRVYRAGFKPAIYYLLGVATYMLFLLVYILLGVAEVDLGSFQPFYMVMLGSAIEAVILSFAIGDKLNSANKLKLEADAAKLAAIQENERIVREQNVILERKVVERTEEINLQKSVIEEKNKDILDSIHYAKRIQRALLASETLLKNNLGDHFVLYKPKDIVSGDFYWADNHEEGKFLLVVGDCTGHGVPGAFMSLLNISLLHESTRGLNITRPDLLLNKQREAIIAALNPPGVTEVSKDGMDCALLMIDFKSKHLSFACANNPLWIYRDGQLIEFKADKQPIGVHEGNSIQYTLHNFDLQKGDVVYAFTDGFADQFGGPRGKKFKYSQLKELIKTIGQLPAAVQREKLEAAFESWRGSLEQVDDVCLIGIRIG